MNVRRIAGIGAATLAVAALLASGGSAARTAVAIPTLDPNDLPKLPDQGLLIAQHGGVLLVGLDGKVIGRLPGFIQFPDQAAASRHGLFAQSTGVQALQHADPALAIVFDGAGRGWLLDAAARKLRRLAPIEVRLAGNTTLAAIVTGNGKSGVATTMTLRRAGSTLLTGDLTVVGTRYVASANFASEKPGVLLDLVTGKRWKLKAQCATAGVVGGKAIAACATPSKVKLKPSRLYAFAPNGTSRPLATYTVGLYVESATLSPDGRWVLLYMAPGCGPGWTAVARSSGGAGRFVTAGGTVPSKGALPKSRFSYGLGWTSDSRIVADVSGPKPSDCEHESASGTFVIDPATLARTRTSASRAFALWNANAPR